MALHALFVLDVIMVHATMDCLELACAAVHLAGKTPIQHHFVINVSLPSLVPAVWPVLCVHHTVHAMMALLAMVSVCVPLDGPIPLSPPAVIFACQITMVPHVQCVPHVVTVHATMG